MTIRTTMKPWLAGTLAAFVLVLLPGCATGPNASSGNPADPLEPFNRTVFKFNDELDRAVIKPVAVAYRDITPRVVRHGVTNFFGNIADVWSLANNVLQLHGTDATDSLFRVTVNTFWGLGGVFDVASEMKIPRHSEDFGQTLGVWGVAPGAYLLQQHLHNACYENSDPSPIKDNWHPAVNTHAPLLLFYLRHDQGNRDPGV